jgi:hypothetical protein
MTPPSRFALLVSLCLVLLPLHASAQEAPRAGRVLFGLTENPAVFVGPDRAWILGSEGDALPTALCGPVLCRPVVRAEACVAPRCPGMGRLVYASERVHDVRDFPTDREGFGRAQTALYAEPSLAPLMSYLQPHPEPAPAPPRPARYSHGTEDWWHLELALAGGIGTGMIHISAPMWEASAFLSLHFSPRGMDDEGLDLIMGSQVGAELRLRVIGNITGQSESDVAVFIGLGGAFGYADGNDVWRVPPLYAWVFPEFGVVVRSDRVPPAWYAGWSWPVTFLVDDHVGLEARANLLLIDDWYPEDDAEVLGTLSLGIVLR